METPAPAAPTTASERAPGVPPDVLLRTVDLRHVYATEEVETAALGGVSLDVRRGEFVAVMGPSGCGKSTLLNIAGLLEKPTGGEYFFDGHPTASLNERKRSALRRGTVGFVFQSFNLIDELTVYENVELPLLYLDLDGPTRKARTEAALERVRMAHRRDHFPGQLSGGQQQRVAIARAVVASPPLILADEPTGNLDSAHGAEVMALLAELNAGGSTIVMVTHSTTDADYAHRIVHLFDGHVVSERFAEKGLAPAAPSA